MPQLNDRERRMLTFVGIGTFVFANFIGFTWLMGAQGKLDREKGRLNGRVQQLKAWSGKAGEALKVEEFIAGNIRTYADEGQRETHLGDLVQGQLINGTGVDVTKFQRLPPRDGEHFDKSRYQSTVEGEWTGVMDFIYRLQSPKDFRFVPRITLVPRKNENNDAEQSVQVTVELEQWWAKPEGSVFTNEETPEGVEQPEAPGVQTSKPSADTSAPENKAADATVVPLAPPALPDPTPAEAAPVTPPTP